MNIFDKINNDILPFDISKKLKEVGYNRLSSHHYVISLTESVDPETGKKEGSFGWEMNELSRESQSFINNDKTLDNSSEHWYMCSAPRIHDVQDWLIEKYNIHFYVAPLRNGYNGGVEYVWCVYEKETSDNPIKKREKAIEKGMKEVFKYLQPQN